MFKYDTFNSTGRFSKDINCKEKNLVLCRGESPFFLLFVIKKNYVKKIVFYYFIISIHLDSFIKLEVT